MTAHAPSDIEPSAKQPTIDDEKKGDQLPEANSPAPSIEIPFSIFTDNEKKFLVFVLAGAALFSPISGSIYYPALTPLADKLHVSISLINLTITTYMIFQGLAPAFVGAFSDAEGRRPAYLACFVLYIAADIGLALQSNYAALMVLRCLQSSGSSGTVALANAVVADFSTPHERGKWMGWANAGALFGPAIGPVIGGLLAQYLGWRSIFWFLAILGGVYLVLIILFFPETCRAVVGNGSIRPSSPWNSCLMDPLLKRRVATNPNIMSPKIPPHALRFPNPLTTLTILFEPEASIVLLSSGFLFAGFYALMAALPSQLEAIYGFDALHVGLCFLPGGIGGSLAAYFTGRLMDINFRRHAAKLGLDASDRRLRSLSSFPIEAARLEVAFPFILLGAATILAFGWTMRYHTHLSGPLILLFFSGYSCTSAFLILSTLTVDLFPEKPATATAANNLTRCWLGGGATALVVPMVNKIGMGWTFTFVAGLWVVLCPSLLAAIKWGPGMRKKKEEKLKAQKGERQAQHGTAV